MDKWFQKKGKTSLNSDFIGALWLLGAIFLFQASYSSVKYVSRSLSSVQIAFLRSTLQGLILIPVMCRVGWGKMKSTHVKEYFFRLTFGTGNIILAFYAFGHMNYATANALIYTRPLFTIVLAAFLLNERAGVRRCLATIAGFAGVFVILNPDGIGLSAAELSALGSAVLLALTYIYIQKLSRTENHAAMLMWFAVVCSSYTCVPAILNWSPVSAGVAGLMVFTAATATGGQYCVIRAYQAGRATVISPLDYFQIPLSAAIGFLFFGETASWRFAAGALLIIAANLYILKEKRKD